MRYGGLYGHVIDFSDSGLMLEGNGSDDVFVTGVRRRGGGIVRRWKVRPGHELTYKIVPWRDGLSRTEHKGTVVSRQGFSFTISGDDGRNPICSLRANIW